MNYFILLLTLSIYSTTSAQFLTDALFTKYSNRNGVNISTDVTSLPKDSIGNVPLSMTIKTLTVENHDGEKNIDRLMREILRDCNKILNQKEYVVISIVKDNILSHKVYEYHNGDVTEIFEVEQEDEQLTVTVTRIIGTTNGKVDFKIQTSNGFEESSH